VSTRKLRMARLERYAGSVVTLERYEAALFRHGVEIVRAVNAVVSDQVLRRKIFAEVESRFELIDPFEPDLDRLRGSVDSRVN
jgi:hypothetical protein